MKRLLVPVLALFALSATYALAAQLPLPAVNGPYLGDDLNNLYQITSAYINTSGLSTANGISASQTSGQTNCTQLNSAALQEIKTSASTGYVCLPTALSGKVIRIGNATGNTIDIYSSNTAYGASTDTINTTAGSTAYTGLTTHISTTCFSPTNGAWYCASSS